MIRTKQSKKRPTGTSVTTDIYIGGDSDNALHQNTKDTQEINNNCTSREKRVEEKGDKLKVEVEKGIDAVDRQFE